MATIQLVQTLIVKLRQRARAVLAKHVLKFLKPIVQQKAGCLKGRARHVQTILALYQLARAA
jgi:hypothetical protein